MASAPDPPVLPGRGGKLDLSRLWTGQTAADCGRVELTNAPSYTHFCYNGLKHNAKAYRLHPDGFGVARSRARAGRLGILYSSTEVLGNASFLCFGSYGLGQGRNYTTGRQLGLPKPLISTALVPGHQYPKAGTRKNVAKHLLMSELPYRMYPSCFRVLMTWGKYRTIT